MECMESVACTGASMLCVGGGGGGGEGVSRVLALKPVQV